MKETNQTTGTQITIEFPMTTKVSKPVSSKVENKLALIDALTTQSDEMALESARLRRQREDEKIKFIGGAEISIREIKDFIATNALPYVPKFPNSNPFFSEMYRLNKWDDLDPDEWIKPLQVPNWINEIIYGRFSKEILPSLQILNPYLPGMCVRGYKNFQFLNENGQKLLEQYRDECVEVMKTCTTWHEFRLKYSQLYKQQYVYQESFLETIN